MRKNGRLLPSAFLLLSLSFANVASIPAQQGPPFEPLVTRLRETLKLDDQQATALRQILVKRATEIAALRRRAEAAPFAPELQQENTRLQQAVREELSALLNEEQKPLLAPIAQIVPVPIAPPFILINIPPRARSAGATALARGERLIAGVALGSKSRAQLNDEQKALHLLNRITYGPRPGELDRARRMGPEKFLDEQLGFESLDESALEERLAALPTLRMTPAELYQFYPPPQAAEQRAADKNAPPIFGRPPQILGELNQQKLVRAVSASRQLYEVMVDFWFNHFNVFALKDAGTWMVTAYERDHLRPHAMGKFRDLLRSVAASPAMLVYLDNWLSAAPESMRPRPPALRRPGGQQPSRAQTGTEMAPGANSTAMPAEPPQRPAPGQQRRPGINENYARELMELHTLGVEGGYTQKDVQEVARAFTGWTVDRPFQGGGFVFRPWMHDNGAKTVLGISIPAGGGLSDGLRVIDILSRHPSTARFISKKLCQRFVSDDPPARLIERAAQTFLKTDGDIREVLRTILTSPEFYSPAVFRAKVKSPLELAASAIRAIDGDTNGAPPLHDFVRRMGQPLYQSQAPTGYGERSEQWMNTGVFLNRLNFATALAENRIGGTEYEPVALIAPEGATDEAMISQLAALIIHTELAPESRRAVLAGTSGPETVQIKEGDPNARRRIMQMVGLLLATPEFQRR
jgi:uncharacterized protein (DUF1800 family)